jgi:hypothetical protein
MGKKAKAAAPASSNLNQSLDTSQSSRPPAPDFRPVQSFDLGFEIGLDDDDDNDTQHAPPRRPRVKPKPTQRRDGFRLRGGRDSSPSDTEWIETEPGDIDGSAPPEGHRRFNEVESTDYRRFFNSKSLSRHSAAILSTLLEIARKHYPADYAVMTAVASKSGKFSAGPCIPCPRRDPPSDSDLKNLIFGHILRLQGSLDITPYSKFFLS